MKNEAAELAIQLENLRRLFKLNKCTQCYLMQSYFKREYKHLKRRLIALEKLSTTNPKLEEFSMTGLRQSTTLIGMYIMV